MDGLTAAPVQQYATHVVTLPHNRNTITERNHNNRGRLPSVRRRTIDCDFRFRFAIVDQFGAARFTLELTFGRRPLAQELLDNRALLVEAVDPPTIEVFPGDALQPVGEETGCRRPTKLICKSIDRVCE